MSHADKKIALVSSNQLYWKVIVLAFESSKQVKYYIYPKVLPNFFW